MSPIAIKLKLPDLSCMYRVVHINCLELYQQCRRDPRLDPRIVLVDMENFLLPVYKIKKIMYSFWDKESRKILYIMLWIGYLKNSNWTAE
jgi:hypothetical protein